MVESASSSEMLKGEIQRRQTITGAFMLGRPAEERAGGSG